MATDQIVTVRLGTPADAEAVLPILYAADLARGRHGFPRDPDRARHRLTGPDAFFVVAENRDEGGTVGDATVGRGAVGLAVGMHSREDGGAGRAIPGLCHITMVAVQPGWWGQGIGKRLIWALLSELRTRGYDRAQLFTQADNTRAQRLYMGLGFSPTGVLAVSYEGEGIVQYLFDVHR
ncbi:GNAT family N-acetyltransferase [Actinomadura sp. HBU206391]|uniref:GNAT family N-acetyltransferase n=1 Tax=Actinomadura sp. HBU206391 TaxID=2731692 RepID=UPI00164FD0C4|nr:N-acetyltransferase [Actinomadura sp. HBU206391]MBC6460754.1 GNAT family N-acetyltransferase [Actinomadura sp. HBU206391]